MTDETMSEPSDSFVIDLDQHLESESSFHAKISAQTKLTLDEEGLGLRWSTGTQEEMPMKKPKKSCLAKAKAKAGVKHTLGTINEKKRNATIKDLKELHKEKGTAEKENEGRSNATNKNENQNLIPQFVVDLLTQDEACEEEEESNPSPCSTATHLGGWGLAGGWADPTDNCWIRVFQARTTEGGADFFVDGRALGDVAATLFRDLTSQKSAAEKSGREY
jgi:hypothetical protein